jgi:hypothetical protein
MIEFLARNREVLTFSVALLGVLLALAFGGVLTWRHKICLDYESRRDVAINILRDRFVQRASDHYTDAADERKKKKTEVEEIYKRPEQQELIRDLAKDLEDQNRVRRYFRWLSGASQACFGCIWASIVITILAIVTIWLAVPSWLVIAWMVLLGMALVGFIGSVSLLWYLDGRFFGLVNRIIEPEGE